MAETQDSNQSAGSVRTREDWVRSLHNRRVTVSTIRLLGRYDLDYRITPRKEGEMVDSLHLSGKEAQMYAWGVMTSMLGGTYTLGVYHGSALVGQSGHSRVRTAMVRGGMVASTGLFSLYLLLRYNVLLS